MRRALILLLLLLTAGGLSAEELLLKDGTKIIGKLTGVNGDKIEVETAYGKMQINRSDIVSITFSQTGAPPAASSAPAKSELPAIEESLNGTQYLNKTGNFSLTLPVEWKINPSLRLSSEVLAGLSSSDDLRYVLVTNEPYTASIESYRGLVEIQAKRNLQNFEKLNETSATIDGKPSLLLSYRGISEAAQNLPIQFLVAIIPSPHGFTRITTWCIEPLFNETQATFEKIIHSYHQASPATTTK